ncbi:diaminopropionate ammonia-lyase [Clostridium carboxidivorans P7]|uniref:diaminopropionate ammonia-lyase n=1 Tax=Clostridium carboxidivorans TaxID=217159 RepID=UPI0001D3928E|nr:diaminopropionate ammonia-lyase [Clostridium carboxidivorans]AKN31785.1 diaminopropionate ammonia-lyase [Clostridium carboxidivorans P7]EFG87385.1 diaminopropionate ammonia-lyase [Clostridium carboxidivorans P7]
MKWIVNGKKNLKEHEPLLNKSDLHEVKSFHESFEQYKQTPLVKLDELANFLGLSNIFVKDESLRFGLNAFKVLGASYAIGKHLSQKLGKDISELPFSALKSEKVKSELGNLIFATTTDGNHGRGVAWMAKQLGYKCIVYMPKGSTQNRVNNIAEFDADVSVTDWNYDDTVRFTAEQASKNGWEVIQDTAWEGYTEVPTWIMKGYSTLAQEAIEQLHGTIPTHVFLQAGVGAFASVIASIFVSTFEKNPPKIVIVEPEKADCFYRSCKAGKIEAVTGEMNTIMAGLACGEPNPVGWDILKCCTDVFVSAPDWVTARGMRVLGNPLKGDNKIISGESGAVTTGLLSILSETKYKDLRETLKLDKNSKVLLISTEGDTDPQIYRNIVWNGDYQSL